MSDPAASSPAAPASRLATFGRRLGTTLILWSAMVAFIVFESGLLCFALISALSLASLYEISRLLPAIDGWESQRRWVLTVAVLYLATSTWWILAHDQAPSFALDAAALALLVQGSFWICCRQPLAGRKTLFSIFFGLFAFTYTILFLACATRLVYFKELDPDGAVPGVWLALFLVAVTKFTDMGAYFIGMLFGRHKMVPHISPGKTWQGFGGAYIGALTASLGLALGFGERLYPIDLGQAVILAFLLGTVAVIGDLAESVLKRCFEAKDSGQTLPGIGGVLDLTDSVLFTAPVLYFYLVLFAS